MKQSTAARRPGRPAGRRGTDLLDTARDVLLEHGFAGATMHDIAARAGVSKSSLYREHDSKDALFAAVVTDWAARGRGSMRPFVDRLLAADDLHAALVELAGIIQAAVVSPDVVQMRRLVAAESDRFPDVAAAYLSDSWDSNIAVLAQAFAKLSSRGIIDIADPPIAAQQFTWTAIGAALNAVTIAGPAAATSARQLSRLANAAADTLLKPSNTRRGAKR